MWQSLLLKQFASTAVSCSSNAFFLIPSWDEYLVSAGKMTVSPHSGVCQLITTGPTDWPTIVLLIALAILDIVLRIAGMAAVIFVIYGGIKYVTSDGEPDKAKEAQQTIINALIGLAVALVAVALVAFIGNDIG